jgi:hypothetical protein
VGITAITLKAWREASHAGIVLVRVVPDAKAEASPTIRLLSPRGYRVDVPDVASAVALLRELG